MPAIQLKTGEYVEVPDNELLSFLQENRDLIQDRYSIRQRPIRRLKQRLLEETL